MYGWISWDKNSAGGWQGAGYARLCITGDIMYQQHETNIPALAAARGITITALAKQVRLSRAYLSKIAWGHACSEDVADRIAAALRVEVTTAFPALVGERAISERRPRTTRVTKKARTKARR